MTELHPLAAIRRQGFDADLYQRRVRVWPRHKMTKTLCQFVTANLPTITEALVAEDNVKSINNVFLWELPAPQRTEPANSEDATGDEIPGYMNGECFAGFKAASV